MSIYLRPSQLQYGIYFPRNSFVTDGTPILIDGNTKYRIHCYSTEKEQLVKCKRVAKDCHVNDDEVKIKTACYIGH